jgi:predicted glycosyltransferase
MRFLFYSHDGMGLGHARRQLAIASALVEMAPNARVLLATSIDEASNFGLPSNVDTLKLPGLRKVANDQYCSRRLGLPGAEIRKVRSALLQAAVTSFSPDVILVDKQPFGAEGELRATLETAKATGTRAVLGLRDILDEPATVLHEWLSAGMQEGIEEFYDRVLIYGEQAIFDPVAAYRFKPALVERMQFCGYVVNARAAWRPGEGSMLSALRPAQVHPVMATTGGGEDGFSLLESFIQAARGAPWSGLAVTGPLLNHLQFEMLQRLASDSGVSLLAFVCGLPDYFHQIRCLVCMGGYNTLTEAAMNGIPVVCVPRIVPRSEQLLRAQRFERLGLLRLIHPAQLTAYELRRAIQLAMQTSRQDLLQRAKTAMRFDGATRAAETLLELACRAKYSRRNLEQLAV